MNHVQHMKVEYKNLLSVKSNKSSNTMFFVMTKITFIFLILFSISFSTAQAQQSTPAEPSFQDCVGNGGYDKKTRQWKKIPQCEQLRWGICSQYYSYQPGGTTWAAFVKTSNGVKYNCADFTQAQDQNESAPTGASMTNTTVDACIYAKYKTSDWSVRLRCDSIHLDVCKELYKKANKRSY